MYLVNLLSTSKRGVGMMRNARRSAHNTPGQYFRGVINGVVNIVIALKVAWLPGQHMHMHMWHRLPGMNSILQHRLQIRNIRTAVQENLYC